MQKSVEDLDEKKRALYLKLVLFLLSLYGDKCPPVWRMNNNPSFYDRENFHIGEDIFWIEVDKEDKKTIIQFLVIPQSTYFFELLFLGYRLQNPKNPRLTKKSLAAQFFESMERAHARNFKFKNLDKEPNPVITSIYKNLEDKEELWALLQNPNETVTAYLDEVFKLHQATIETTEEEQKTYDRQKLLIYKTAFGYLDDILNQ